MVADSRLATGRWLIVGTHFFGTRVVGIGFSIGLTHSLLKFSIVSRTPAAAGPVPLSRSAFAINDHAFSSQLLINANGCGSVARAKTTVNTSRTRVIAITVHHAGVNRGDSRPGLLSMVSPSGCAVLPGATNYFSTRATMQAYGLTHRLLNKRGLIGLRILNSRGALCPGVVRALGTTGMLVSSNFRIVMCASSSPVITRRLRDVNYITVVPLNDLVNSNLNLLGHRALDLVIRGTGIPILISTNINATSSTTVTVRLNYSNMLVGSTVTGTGSPIVVTRTVGRTI